MQAFEPPPAVDLRRTGWRVARSVRSEGRGHHRQNAGGRAVLCALGGLGEAARRARNPDARKPVARSLQDARRAGDAAVPDAAGLASSIGPMTADRRPVLFAWPARLPFSCRAGARPVQGCPSHREQRHHEEFDKSEIAVHACPFGHSVEQIAIQDRRFQGALRPAHQRRHRTQDGLDVAAGLQAEHGAAVIEQIEFDIEPAAGELLARARLRSMAPSSARARSADRRPAAPGRHRA